MCTFQQMAHRMNSGRLPSLRTERVVGGRLLQAKRYPSALHTLQSAAINSAQSRSRAIQCRAAAALEGIGAKPIPPVVSWFVEPRCNYLCKFCFATFTDIPDAEVVKDTEALFKASLFVIKDHETIQISPGAHTQSSRRSKAQQLHNFSEYVLLQQNPSYFAHLPQPAYCTCLHGVIMVPATAVTRSMLQAMCTITKLQSCMCMSRCPPC